MRHYVQRLLKSTNFQRDIKNSYSEVDCKGKDCCDFIVIITVVIVVVIIAGFIGTEKSYVECCGV